MRCDVRVATSGGTTSTAASPLSIVTGASSSFLESLLVEDAGMVLPTPQSDLATLMRDDMAQYAKLVDFAKMKD